MTIKYDEETDVLYAFKGEKPLPTESVDYDNGVVLRIDPHFKKYVGFTIINYIDKKNKAS